MYELIPNISCTKPSEIARQFLPDFSAEEIKASLQFLLKNNFLEKKDDGRYERTTKMIPSSKKDLSKSSIRLMHSQISKMSFDALDDLPASERDFSALVLGISKQSYEKILVELEAFRKKILDIAVNDQNVEKIYFLGLKLFPLTRKNISSKK